MPRCGDGGRLPRASPCAPSTLRPCPRPGPGRRPRAAGPRSRLGRRPRGGGRWPRPHCGGRGSGGRVTCVSVSLLLSLFPSARSPLPAARAHTRLTATINRRAAAATDPTHRCRRSHHFSFLGEPLPERRVRSRPHTRPPGFGTSRGRAWRVGSRAASHTHHGRPHDGGPPHPAAPSRWRAARRAAARNPPHPFSPATGAAPGGQGRGLGRAPVGIRAAGAMPPALSACTQPASTTSRTRALARPASWSVVVADGSRRVGGKPARRAV